MKLCFPTEYTNFADREHFTPRLAALQKSYEETLRNKDTDIHTLLNRMEDMQELMRYYAHTGDYGALEPVMRTQAEYLEQCRSCGVLPGESRAGLSWLEMDFARINAQLFMADQDVVQARPYYQEAFTLAGQCFSNILNNNRLSEEQLLYIGWACAETMQEAASADSAETLDRYHALIPILEYLEPLMKDYILIRDQTAELYLAAAGVLFSYGEQTQGSRLFQHASLMFRELYHTHGADIHLVRALWTECLYSLQVLSSTGQTELLLRCEAAAENVSQTITAALEHNILQAIRGLTASQKSIPLQASGQTEQAAALSHQGCRLLVQALRGLEQEREADSYLRGTILSGMLIRIYHGYAAALDLLGVQCISLSRPEEAADAFLKILALLRDEQQKLAGTDLSVMRAEALQYLALIALMKDNGQECQFYGEQAVQNALEAAERTGLPAAWAIAIMSCSILSEYYLQYKDKARAAHYANTGLTACDRLRQIDSCHEQLALSHRLMQLKKKAARRIF
ncbi:MAG: hypothetical protein J6A08_09225 [Lachnospiraceae bacterium]|nr:hypothetical protein [Lachnospiraceae bacterium]